MTSRRRTAAPVTARTGVAAVAGAPQAPAQTTPTLPPLETTTTSTTSPGLPPIGTTTTTAPPGPPSGGPTTTTTPGQPAPPPSNGSPPPASGPGPAPGQPGPPPGPALGPGGVVLDPAAVQQILNGLVRSGASTTAPLIDALRVLEDFGLTPVDAAVVGMGHFPVGGYAAFTDDWLMPRAGPPPHLHQGNDIFAAMGTPIRAAVDGVFPAVNPKPILDGWLAEALAQVPALVASYQHAEPRVAAALATTRRFDLGGQGFSGDVAMPVGQLLWESAVSPAGSGFRVAQVELGEAAAAVDWAAWQRRQQAEAAARPPADD